jgi:hypothetical protein
VVTKKELFIDFMYETHEQLLVETYRNRNINIGTLLHARLIISANDRKDVAKTGRGDV